MASRGSQYVGALDETEKGPLPVGTVKDNLKLTDKAMDVNESQLNVFKLATEIIKTRGNLLTDMESQHVWMVTAWKILDQLPDIPIGGSGSEEGNSITFGQVNEALNTLRSRQREVLSYLRKCKASVQVRIRFIKMQISRKLFFPLTIDILKQVLEDPDKHEKWVGH